MDISTIAEHPKLALGTLVAIGVFIAALIYAWIQEGRGNGD